MGGNLVVLSGGDLDRHLDRELKRMEQHELKAKIRLKSVLAPGSSKRKGCR
jgi:hypothetical protein